jgi:hypothetical protein
MFEDPMRTRNRILAALAMICSLPAPAEAGQTITGTLPPGRRLAILAVRKPSLVQPLQFRFYAPPVNAGVDYALNFCIGPRANPCGLPSDIVVNVPKGQTRLETFSSDLFATNVLAVGQGTRVSVPYSVTITP